MKIATTTWDFEEYVSSPFEVGTILEMLNDSGFKHVDINLGSANNASSPFAQNTWEQWAYELGNTAARLGMDFVQAHSSDPCIEPGEQHDREMEYLRNEIRICKMLGISGMTVHGIEKADTDREWFMQANVDFYNELMPVAEETGVVLYTENTCYKNAPFYYLITGEDMNELRERMNKHPLFGFCWDVGHANVDRLDQYKEIITMGDGLKAVHIHDNFLHDTHGQMYSGTCGYDPIVKGMLDVNYKGYFTLEALSLPSPKKFLGRPALIKDGVIYDKLTTLPIELKIRSERLMRDIAQYILDTYDCYED